MNLRDIIDELQILSPNNDNITVEHWGSEWNLDIHKVGKFRDKTSGRIIIFLYTEDDEEYIEREYEEIK